MKKTILLLIILITSFGFSQTQTIGTVTINGGPKGDPTQVKTINGQSIEGVGNIVIASNGDGNPNITIPSDVAEITSAGDNAYIEFQTDIILTSNFQIPSGQTWHFTTGSLDIDNYQLDFNGVNLLFNGKRKALDISDGSVIGIVGLESKQIYASNIGMVDDGVFDNFIAEKNMLHIVNQNSGTFVHNKQTVTAQYFMNIYDDSYGSAFFANGFGNDNVLIIGNGAAGGDSYDNITITSEGGVTIKINAGSQLGSSIYSFFNTKNSTVTGNHFIGDRFEHFYDQEIKITAAATSAGNVRLRIIEHPDYQDNVTEKEINELIPLTLSNKATNRQEIIDFINTDSAFSDWTATALAGNDNNITLRGQAGQYSTVIFSDETSGASASYSLKLYEWGHAVIFSSRAVDCNVTNNVFENFHGDGVAKDDHGNGNSDLDDTDMTEGFIDEDGNISANSEYYYLTATRDLPTPHKWFRFFPGSSTSVYLKNFRYWMVYYDENDVFIEKSPQLTPYDRYYYPDNFKKYRLLIDYNGATEWGNFRWFITSPSFPEGGLIARNKFFNNRRHGITNPPNYSIVEWNIFDSNSGVDPQVDMNIEDWGKKVSGQIVRFNTFRTTNVANLSIKGANRVQVYGNTFEQGSRQLTPNDWNSKTQAILTSFARGTKIYNNFFVNKATNVDILTDSYHNHYTNSVLYLRSGSPKVKDETFINTIIKDGLAGGVDTEGLGGNGMANLEDCIFYINEGWGNQAFIHEYNTINHKNLTYYFNDKTINHASLGADEAIRNVYINGTSSNYLRADKATQNDGEHDGSYDGTFVYGALVNPNSMHYVGWKQYASKKHKNFDINIPLIINNGYEKSMKISDGIVHAPLWLQLGEFPTDGVGAFETITIEDVEINVSEDISANEGWLNNSNYGGTGLNNLFRITQDVNVNLVFKNCKFISKSNATGLFMYLGNRGTTNFIDCTFDAPNAENVDFTSTGNEKTSGVYAGANTGTITITRPITPGNRITFTGATIN